MLKNEIDHEQKLYIPLFLTEAMDNDKTLTMMHANTAYDIVNSPDYSSSDEHRTATTAQYTSVDQPRQEYEIVDVEKDHNDQLLC